VATDVQATVSRRSRRDVSSRLALTTFDDDEGAGRHLRAGASGFILKGVPAEDLQRAVGRWPAAAPAGPGGHRRVLAIYRRRAPRGRSLGPAWMR